MKKDMYILIVVGLLLSSLMTACSPDYEEDFIESQLIVSDGQLAPISFDLTGGEITITVESNVTDWDATANAEWCNVLKHDDKVTISAGRNDLYLTRIALVTISYGHYSYDIPVSQFGKSFSILVDGKQSGLMKKVTPLRQELSVEVSSEVPLDFIIIPDSTSWIRLKSNVQKADDVHVRTLTFDIDKSTSSTYRYSTITLKSLENYTNYTTFLIAQEALEFEMIPLTVDMLSTNAQETNEGPISNLLDGDKDTYFHSAYSYSIDEAHYIQVSLGSSLTELKFWYKNRSNSNGKPTQALITVSQDGIHWSTVDIVYGLPTAASSEYESALFSVPEEFSYFRFIVNKTNSGEDFFNMAEFKMYTTK